MDVQTSQTGDVVFHPASRTTAMDVDQEGTEAPTADAQTGSGGVHPTVATVAADGPSSSGGDRPLQKKKIKQQQKKEKKEKAKAAAASTSYNATSAATTTTAGAGSSSTSATPADRMNTNNMHVNNDGNTYDDESASEIDDEAKGLNDPETLESYQYQLGPTRPINETSQPDWAGDVSFMGPVIPSR